MQTMVIIGESERRTQLKRILREHRDIQVIGEIVDPGALRFLPELAPDIVVVDCEASSINPVLTLQRLRDLPNAPRVVALAATNTMSERTLVHELGAACALLEVPSTVREALSLRPTVSTAPRWPRLHMFGAQAS